MVRHSALGKVTLLLDEADLALLPGGAIALLDDARQAGGPGAVGVLPVARADLLHELADHGPVAEPGRCAQLGLGRHAGVVAEDAQGAARLHRADDQLRAALRA